MSSPFTQMKQEDKDAIRAAFGKALGKSEYEYKNKYNDEQLKSFASMFGENADNPFADLLKAK